MLNPFEEEIIVALRQISQAIDLYSHYLLQQVGFSAPQLGVLREIDDAGEITPGALADRLHLSPQTIAGILNRLQKRRLIVRQKNTTTDRRSVLVRITAAGRKAARTAPPLLRDKFRTRLAQLEPWEQSAILATLQRVASMINAEDLAVEPFLETSSAAKASTLSRRPKAKAKRSPSSSRK